MEQKLTILIEDWAKERGLDSADPKGQVIKLGEEFGELCNSIVKEDDELFKDSLGDMYVVLTILALQRGENIIDCIRMAYEEIKDRKGQTIDGIFLKESDIKR